MTGTRGSAALYADVPLPPSLKIEEPLARLDVTVLRILNAVDRYKELAGEMRAYSEFVAAYVSLSSWLLMCHCHVSSSSYDS
jgi:hypothetical protein